MGQIARGGGAVSRKRSERLVAILELLRGAGTVSLADMTAQLGVSEATLRRDLTELETQGVILRTHGGARENDATLEVPVRLRDSTNREEKRLIARAAALLVPREPFAIAIGGGSTTAELARTLADRSDLAILTNSLTTAMEIAHRPNLKVVMMGGVVRRSSFEAVGALAESSFRAINVGIAFLGADGVSADGGVTTHDETEARTNNAMVTHARTAVVVADSSKIGRATFARVCGMQDVARLITDQGADPQEIERIRALGVEVTIV